MLKSKTPVCKQPKYFVGEDDGCGYCSGYEEAKQAGKCKRGYKFKFRKCGYRKEWSE